MGATTRTTRPGAIGDASYRFTVGAVSPDGKAWLRSLPRELRVEAGGYRLHLVHGSPRRINEYLLTDRDPRTFERLAAAEDADVLVFGHTHAPWHRQYAGVHFVNVGSVGRPKDGDPRAAYTLLRFAPGLVEAETVRVAYDAEETARAVLAVGLPRRVGRVVPHGSGLTAVGAGRSPRVVHQVSLAGRPAGVRRD